MEMVLALHLLRAIPTGIVRRRQFIYSIFFRLFEVCLEQFERRKIAKTSELQLIKLNGAFIVRI